MDTLNRKLRRVLKQDTEFLIRHGFLDYSLLLAIEKCPEAKKFDVKRRRFERRLTRGLVKRRTAFLKPLSRPVSAMNSQILSKRSGHVENESNNKLALSSKAVKAGINQLSTSDRQN